ncbi:C2 domain-containing protein 3, partial [Rhizophlyctis rosea]
MSSAIPTPSPPPSLPPKVSGPVRSFLSLTVSKLVWTNPPTLSTQQTAQPRVRVSWWGDDGPPTIFHPASIGHRGSNTAANRLSASSASSIPVRSGNSPGTTSGRITVQFPVRCTKSQFAAYLKDMGPLGFTVMMGGTVIGKATIPDVTCLASNPSKPINGFFSVIDESGSSGSGRSLGTKGSVKKLGELHLVMVLDDEAVMDADGERVGTPETSVGRRKRSSADMRKIVDDGNVSGENDESFTKTQADKTLPQTTTLTPPNVTVQTTSESCQAQPAATPQPSALVNSLLSQAERLRNAMTDSLNATKHLRSSPNLDKVDVLTALEVDLPTVSAAQVVRVAKVAAEDSGGDHVEEEDSCAHTDDISQRSRDDGQEEDLRGDVDPDQTQSSSASSLDASNLLEDDLVIEALNSKAGRGLLEKRLGRNAAGSRVGGFDNTGEDENLGDDDDEEVGDEEDLEAEDDEEDGGESRDEVRRRVLLAARRGTRGHKRRPSNDQKLESTDERPSAGKVDSPSAAPSSQPVPRTLPSIFTPHRVRITISKCEIPSERLKGLSGTVSLSYTLPGDTRTYTAVSKGVPRFVFVKGGGTGARRENCVVTFDFERVGSVDVGKWESGVVEIELHAGRVGRRWMGSCEVAGRMVLEQCVEGGAWKGKLPIWEGEGRRKDDSAVDSKGRECGFLFLGVEFLKTSEAVESGESVPATIAHEQYQQQTSSAPAVAPSSNPPPIPPQYLHIRITTARSLSIPLPPASKTEPPPTFVYLSTRLPNHQTPVESPPVLYRPPFDLRTGRINEEVDFGFRYTVPVGVDLLNTGSDGSKSAGKKAVVVEVWVVSPSASQSSGATDTPHLLGLIRLPFQTLLDALSSSYKTGGGVAMSKEPVMVPECEYSVVDVVEGGKVRGWVRGFCCLGSWEQVRGVLGDEGVGRERGRKEGRREVGGLDVGVSVRGGMVGRGEGEEEEEEEEDSGESTPKARPSPRRQSSPSRTAKSRKQTAAARVQRATKDASSDIPAECVLEICIHSACGVRGLIDEILPSLEEDAFATLTSARTAGCGTYVTLRPFPESVATVLADEIDDPISNSENEAEDAGVIVTPVVEGTFTPRWEFVQRLRVRGVDTRLVEWMKGGGEARGDVWVRGERGEDVRAGVFGVSMRGVLGGGGEKGKWVRIGIAVREVRGVLEGWEEDGEKSVVVRVKYPALRTDGGGVKEVWRVSDGMPLRTSVGGVFFVRMEYADSIVVAISADEAKWFRSRGVECEVRVVTSAGASGEEGRLVGRCLLHVRDVFEDVRRGRGTKGVVEGRCVLVRENSEDLGGARCHVVVEVEECSAPKGKDVVQGGVVEEKKEERMRPLDKGTRSKPVVKDAPPSTIPIHITIERALHLPLMRDPLAMTCPSPFVDDDSTLVALPNSFVSFSWGDDRDDGSDLSGEGTRFKTPVVNANRCPVWNYETCVEIPRTEACLRELKEGGKALLFRVMHVSGVKTASSKHAFAKHLSFDGRNRQVVRGGRGDEEEEIGVARVDLGSLFGGLREVYGWYHVLCDRGGGVRGQVMVRVWPGEGLGGVLRELSVGKGEGVGVEGFRRKGMGGGGGEAVQGLRRKGGGVVDSGVGSGGGSGGGGWRRWQSEGSVLGKMQDTWVWNGNGWQHRKIGDDVAGGQNVGGMVGVEKAEKGESGEELRRSLRERLRELEDMQRKVREGQGGGEGESESGWLRKVDVTGVDSKSGGDLMDGGATDFNTAVRWHSGKNEGLSLVSSSSDESEGMKTQDISVGSVNSSSGRSSPERMAWERDDAREGGAEGVDLLGLSPLLERVDEFHEREPAVGAGEVAVWEDRSKEGGVDSGVDWLTGVFDGLKAQDDKYEPQQMGGDQPAVVANDTVPVNEMKADDVGVDVNFVSTHKGPANHFEAVHSEPKDNIRVDEQLQRLSLTAKEVDEDRPVIDAVIHNRSKDFEREDDHQTQSINQIGVVEDDLVEDVGHGPAEEFRTTLDLGRGQDLRGIEFSDSESDDEIDEMRQRGVDRLLRYGRIGARDVDTDGVSDKEEEEEEEEGNEVADDSSDDVFSVLAYRRLRGRTSAPALGVGGRTSPAPVSAATGLVASLRGRRSEPRDVAVSGGMHRDGGAAAIAGAGKPPLAPAGAPPRTGSLSPVSRFDPFGLAGRRGWSGRD